MFVFVFVDALLLVLVWYFLLVGCYLLCVDSLLRVSCLIIYCACFDFLLLLGFMGCLLLMYVV